MTSQAYLSIPVSPLPLFLFALLTSILDYPFLRLLWIFLVFHLMISL